MSELFAEVVANDDPESDGPADSAMVSGRECGASDRAIHEDGQSRVLGDYLSDTESLV